MNITPRQVQLLRTTFALLRPKARVAALAFYQRLFALDPSLRPLFHTAIETQAEKLIGMLQTATDLAGQPAILEPILASLGERHVGYGVRLEHYDTVGAALLWALGATLAEEFTPEAREAWAVLYGVISSAMQRGAALAAQPSSSRAD